MISGFFIIELVCARRETRTLKDCTPTASETATFTNFAIRAVKQAQICSTGTKVGLFSEIKKLR